MENLKNTLVLSDDEGTSAEFAIPTMLTVVFVDGNGSSECGVMMGSDSLMKAIRMYFDSLSKDA